MLLLIIQAVITMCTKTDTYLFALDFIFFKPFNGYAACLQVYSTNHSGVNTT